MSTLTWHDLFLPRIFREVLYRVKIYNHLVNNDRVSQDILFWKKKDCYHGNQFTAVFMSCNDTEETLLVYDSLH